MIAKLRDMKIASINDLLARISAANATAKRHKLWPSAIFGQARKLPWYMHKTWMDFSMFKSRLSWDCWIFEHSRLNKSSLTSDYYRWTVRNLQSLLCKVLLFFDNSKLIDCAFVFLVCCKLEPEWHPLFCHLLRSHLVTRYLYLLFSEKSAHFEPETIALFINWVFFTFLECFS